MASKKRLAEMKMPEKKKLKLDELAGHDEGSPEEESLESPEEEAQEPDAQELDSASAPEDSMEMPPEHEAPAGADDQLAQASDDDLMAEIQKRGLLKQLEEQDQNSQGDQPREEDQSMYS